MNFYTGARPDAPDKRDYKVEQLFGALPAIDFAKAFYLPEPPNEDQYASLSCVAHAWSYYHWQLKQKDYSRRDLYSRIFFPEGGAYIRDGGIQIVKKGQATRDEAPDPNPQTELAMRDGSGITDEERASDIEANSFVLPENDINGIAWGIQNYKGVVFGVQVDSNFFTNPTEPNPPTSDKITGHAIYAFGYHLHNGQRCLLCKSSWCDSGKTVHHIRENYFEGGGKWTFNAWTLIPKQDIMYNLDLREIVAKDGKTIYLAVGAPDMEALEAMKTLLTKFGGTLKPRQDAKEL